MFLCVFYDFYMFLNSFCERFSSCSYSFLKVGLDLVQMLTLCECSYNLFILHSVGGWGRS